MELSLPEVNLGAGDDLIDPAVRLLNLRWSRAGRRTRRNLSLYNCWSKKRPKKGGANDPTGEATCHQSLFSFTKGSGESTTAVSSEESRLRHPLLIHARLVESSLFELAPVVGSNTSWSQTHGRRLSHGFTGCQTTSTSKYKGNLPIFRS